MRVLAAIGVAVAAMAAGAGAATLARRRARPTHPLARRSAQVEVALATALVVAAVGVAILLGGHGGNPFAGTPAFASLRAHPDHSLRGVVAYDAPASPGPQGKQSCVMVVAAGGGEPRRLVCVPVTKAMGPVLRWVGPGRLEVTSRSGPRWRREIEVASGAVTELTYAPPAALPARGPGGEVVSWRNADGLFRALVRRGSRTSVLVAVDAPPTYGWGEVSWSGSDTWFVVDDSAGRVLVVTTAPPRVRVLAEAGELAVAGE